MNLCLIWHFIVFSLSVVVQSIVNYVHEMSDIFSAMLRIKCRLCCEIRVLNSGRIIICNYLDFFQVLVSIEIVVLKGKTNVTVIKQNLNSYIKSGFHSICSGSIIQRSFIN